MKNLVQTTEGERGVLSKIAGDKRFLSRITSVGLTVGTEVEVIQNQGRYPILLHARDSVLAINRQEAANISMEVEK